MTFSKSERRLLSILALIVVAAAYYFFVYSPQERAIAELENQRIIAEDSRDKTMAIIATRPKLARDLQALQSNIANKSVRFYGKLDQDNYIMTLNQLAQKADIAIQSVKMNDEDGTIEDFIDGELSSNRPQAEAIKTELALSEEALKAPLSTHTSTIGFQGTYTNLRQFLSGFANFPKAMRIDSIELNTRSDGELQGAVSVSATHMPSIDAYVDKNVDHNYFAVASTRSTYDNIFAPYDAYAQLPSSDTHTVQSLDIFRHDNPLSDLNSDVDITAPAPNRQALEVATTLTDFKANHYFFVGSKPNIKGSAFLDDAPIGQAKCLLLTYQFSDLNGVNAANIAFVEQAVMQQSQASHLRLKVYSDIKLKNAMKAEIVDARAEHYTVAFDPVDAAKDWQYLYAELPTTIQYPFMVKRLYSEGGDIYQDVTAKVFIDELAAVTASSQATSEEATE